MREALRETCRGRRRHWDQNRNNVRKSGSRLLPSLPARIRAARQNPPAPFAGSRQPASVSLAAWRAHLQRSQHRVVPFGSGHPHWETVWSPARCRARPSPRLAGQGRGGTASHNDRWHGVRLHQERGRLPTPPHPCKRRRAHILRHRSGAATTLRKAALRPSPCARGRASAERAAPADNPEAPWQGVPDALVDLFHLDPPSEARHVAVRPPTAVACASAARPARSRAHVAAEGPDPVRR